MQLTEETQRCSKCGQEKPLSAYRRQRQRANGRDTICKACRKKAYDEAKAGSFGPLPEPEGSERWVNEIWRRAGAIRRERQRG